MGRYGLEEKDFDFSAERVTASVHESLARLGLEYLDVVQAHDVEFGSLTQARLFAMRIYWSLVTAKTCSSLHAMRPGANAHALLEGQGVPQLLALSTSCRHRHATGACPQQSGRHFHVARICLPEAVRQAQPAIDFMHNRHRSWRKRSRHCRSSKRRGWSASSASLACL